MNQSNSYESMVSDGLPAYGGSIRIITLPSGYETELGVISLVESVLKIGKVLSVQIQQRKTGPQNNILYYTAYIDFKYWLLKFDNEKALSLIHQIESIMTFKNEKVICDKNILLKSDEVNFQWLNGNVMEYLAIRPVDRGLGGCNYVNGENVNPNYMSLYIPRIPENMILTNGNYSTSYHNKDLQDIIETKFQFGKVSRIDFVTNENENGTKSQSAFIHFSEWYETNGSKSLRYKLVKNDSVRYYGFNDGLNSYNFASYENSNITNRFLVFKINHKPIPLADESQNVHQLAAANLYLDNLVKEKDALIESMTKEIEELRKKIVDTDTVVVEIDL